MITEKEIISIVYLSNAEDRTKELFTLFQTELLREKIKELTFLREGCSLHCMDTDLFDELQRKITELETQLNEIENGKG